MIKSFSKKLRKELPFLFKLWDKLPKKKETEVPAKRKIIRYSILILLLFLLITTDFDALLKNVGSSKKTLVNKNKKEKSHVTTAKVGEGDLAQDNNDNDPDVQKPKLPDNPEDQVLEGSLGSLDELASDIKADDSATSASTPSNEIKPEENVTPPLTTEEIPEVPEVPPVPPENTAPIVDSTSPETPIVEAPPEVPLPEKVAPETTDLITKELESLPEPKVEPKVEESPAIPVVENPIEVKQEIVFPEVKEAPVAPVKAPIKKKISKTATDDNQNDFFKDANLLKKEIVKLEKIRKRTVLEPTILDSTERSVSSTDEEINFSATGSGLVYNCSGQHWACLNSQNHAACKKSKNCIAKSLYSNQGVCAKAQMKMMELELNPCH